MNHSFIDKYSDLDSLIHRLDPRTKIMLMLSYIILVVTTRPNQFYQFAGYFAVIFLVIIFSKIPLSYVLGRLFALIPFLVMISLPVLFLNPANDGHSALPIFWNVFIKSLLALFSMIVLSSTTRFTVLLKGLEKLAFPRIFIMIFSFMYRYTFILFDEAMRMRRAQSLRFFGGNISRQIKMLSNIIAVLFIRAYERGERVYKSMVSRGFDGEVRTLNLLRYSLNDFLFSFAFWVSLILLKVYL